MRVTTLFFGAVSDIVGMRESSVDVPEGSTATDVLSRLCESHPEMKRKNILIAIDENHATGDEILAEGNSVAFFTAVSGG